MSSENMNTNYKKRPALLCITTTVLAKVSLHLKVHFKWTQGHGKKWYSVWWGRKKYSFTREVGEAETFQLRYCKIEQKRLFCTLSCLETVQVWLETFFPSNLKNKHSQWGGLLPEKNWWGCTAHFPKPLQYLWPVQKLNTLFMTAVADTDEGVWFMVLSIMMKK